MSHLYLPPGVTREMLAEREEREAQAYAQGVFVRDERCREFNPLLVRVDPYLSMVFCREPAPLEAVACGARPGRYNLVREAPGAPLSFIPIIGPDGEFVEPTSRIFDELKAMDWWNADVKRDRQAREDRLEDARRKTEEAERERMTDEVLERYLAGTRTQVSMNPDVPWAQNAAGFKRIKGEKKKAP